MSNNDELRFSALTLTDHESSIEQMTRGCSEDDATDLGAACFVILGHDFEMDNLGSWGTHNKLHGLTRGEIFALVREIDASCKEAVASANFRVFDARKALELSIQHKDNMLTAFPYRRDDVLDASMAVARARIALKSATDELVSLLK